MIEGQKKSEWNMKKREHESRLNCKRLEEKGHRGSGHVGIVISVLQMVVCCAVCDVCCGLINCLRETAVVCSNTGA